MDRDVFQTMAQTQESHWWFVARRKNLRAILETLPRPASILEVGCGTGANLEMLAAFGEVTGVELDAEARIAAGRLSPSAKVLSGYLPDGLPNLGKRFDLVCLFDVLEHIDDDVSALKALAGQLAPGGHIVLTVPAYPWLFGAHDRRHHHHRRYSRVALLRAISASGLSLLRIGHFNALLFPLAVGQRLVAAVGLGQDEADAQPGSMVNAALETVFGLERHVLPRAFFPWGLSLVAVLTNR